MGNKDKLWEIFWWSNRDVTTNTLQVKVGLRYIQ